MNIGKVIAQYRKKNKLSQREFAARCGTSNSYIAMLESGKNSATGLPIVPTLTTLSKIAAGMGMSINELIDICDDMPVTIGSDKKENPPILSEDERRFQAFMKEVEEIFRQMTPEDQQLYRALLRRGTGKS